MVVVAAATAAAAAATVAAVAAAVATAAAAEDRGACWCELDTASHCTESQPPEVLLKFWTTVVPFFYCVSPVARWLYTVRIYAFCALCLML